MLACDSPVVVGDLAGSYAYVAVETEGAQSLGERWTGELLIEDLAGVDGHAEFVDADGDHWALWIMELRQRGGRLTFHLSSLEGFVVEHSGTMRGRTITGTVMAIDTYVTTDTLWRGTFTATRR